MTDSALIPSVIFEDDNLLVFDKPSGLVVNKSQTTPTGTLQDYLLESKNFKELLSKYSNEENPEFDEFISRVGVVHRIDKDTSGLILVSKDPVTFKNLQKLFRDRLIHKEYIAVAHGKLNDELFEIDAPIGRDRSNRMKYAISPRGKEAFTSFEVLNRIQYDDFWVSSVKCFPKTGRTHQLRVHLAAMGSPIIHDVIYSGRRQLKWVKETLEIDRMLLHASKMAFEYNNKKVSFESEMPSIFEKFL